MTRCDGGGAVLGLFRLMEVVVPVDLEAAVVGGGWGQTEGVTCRQRRSRGA
jgi:hypothetical protein